jgi:hypothetical protein
MYTATFRLLLPVGASQQRRGKSSSAPPEADIALKLLSHPKTKPQPTVRRGSHHTFHIGLAFKTRLLSAKSVNIMISGNVRIWGIDISNIDGNGSNGSNSGVVSTTGAEASFPAPAKGQPNPDSHSKRKQQASVLCQHGNC